MSLKNKFWCKVVKTKTDIVVAICDKNLLGKKIEIEEGFSIRIKQNFYKDKIISEKEAVELMKNATILNVFGKNIIKLAIENEVISKENVIFFNGVPHAQFVKI